jgi:hypothetical protein
MGAATGRLQTKSRNLGRSSPAKIADRSRKLAKKEASKPQLDQIQA